MPNFLTRAQAATAYMLTLIDDTGAPTDWTIHIVGADSEAYRNAQREIQQRNIASINRARRLTQTPEELEAQQIELMVAATVGWSDVELDGVPVPFTPANARRLYEEVPGIREQVDRAINDRANFLTPAATN